mgnify:CR=1 FL=1
MQDSDDPVLGTLRYDAESKWFEGEWVHGAVTIAFSISADVEDLEDEIVYAQSILTQLESILRDAKDYACFKMIEIKNEDWLDEDE